MDNTSQIKRRHYAKICEERILLYDLRIKTQKKSGNLKPQGSSRVVLLICFLFRSLS